MDLLSWLVLLMFKSLEMQIIAYNFICTYLYLNFTLICVIFEKQILDPKKSCEGVKISKVKMFSPQHVV
jgi:hypothetical protein